ncbi:PD-(D/E)XK nuclease family protein [Polaribacter sp. M15]
MKVEKKYFDQINSLIDKYQKQKKDDRFNIFYALHKEHDEVNLHSRFISYLLSNDSGHQKGNTFKKLFFEIVLHLDFIKGFEVIPNEFNKTEFKEIDILLFNKTDNHGIIIENKIYAKDSNHKNKIEGYNGQLERYYNTLIKGTPIDNELEINSEPIKKIEFKKHKFICKTVDIYYLTLNKPKKENFNLSLGNTLKKEDVTIVYYKNEIVDWLNKCLETLENDFFIHKIIKQYLILIKNMTKTNIPYNELNELRELFSKELKSTKYIVENFKHIKWHTVDSFLNELKNSLKLKGLENVKLYPLQEEERLKNLEELTHFNNDINMGVFFEVNKLVFYISTLNNLSWGIVETEKWKDFSHNTLQNIRFSDFSTENTYNLIDKSKSKEAINNIIEEILDDVIN